MMNKIVLSCIAITISFLCSKAQASCLGLKPPAPVNTNICETLVEKLVIPKVELFCDIPTWARIFMPHCNLPGACHTSPSCKSFEVTREVVGTIYNAGDLYCDFREISPEKMINDIANKAYKNLVTLTTGGLDSILFRTANAHIDVMSCAGINLNEQLKNSIQCVVSNSTEPRSKFFFPIDIENVRIISNKSPTAKLYLRNGFAAITLYDLIIINDQDFQVLKNWNKQRGDTLNRNERGAIELIIHELVHARQYRNMGKEVFINTYLTEAIYKSYANISTELEASTFVSTITAHTSSLSCTNKSLQSFSSNIEKHSLSSTAIRGSACKANDVGALTAGQLIRTTNGITNKSNKNISIYCPVDTDTINSKLKVSISFETESLSNVGTTDVVVPKNLECWLATKYGPSREYRKFSQKGTGSDFKTYVTVNTSGFNKQPVTIKCNLRPNEHIIGIKSE